MRLEVRRTVADHTFEDHEIIICSHNYALGVMPPAFRDQFCEDHSSGLDCRDHRVALDLENLKRFDIGLLLGFEDDGELVEFGGAGIIFNKRGMCGDRDEVDEGDVGIPLRGGVSFADESGVAFCGVSLKHISFAGEKPYSV